MLVVKTLRSFLQVNHVIYSIFAKTTCTLTNIFLIRNVLNTNSQLKTGIFLRNKKHEILAQMFSYFCWTISISSMFSLPRFPWLYALHLKQILKSVSNKREQGMFNPGFWTEPQRYLIYIDCWCSAQLAW